MSFIEPNLHPFFVHFTVALISVSFIAFLFGNLFIINEQWRKESYIVSRWCLWLGALASIATVAAGFHAYYTVAHEGMLTHHAMGIHRNWALGATTVILLVALWSIILYKRKGAENSVFGVGLLVSVLLVMITGWYGAHLVYGYGLGVSSLSGGCQAGSPSPKIMQGHGNHAH